MMPGYLGRFLDSLAVHCVHITLFLHLPDEGENSKFDYAIQSKKISLVSLPARGSVPNRALLASKYSNIVSKYSPDLDGLLIRGPSPLLPSLARAVKQLPVILLLVGDYFAGVDASPQPGWRRELIRLWTWYNYQGQKKAMRKSLVFVNSRLLFDQFKGKSKQILETRTTTLSEEDLFFRDDTCVHKPIHLLYTGRFDLAKGLLDIVKAMAILCEEGEDIVLDLVGWPEKDSDILLQIDVLAAEKGIHGRIVNHGYKSVGPELFEYYKNADIYILASQSSFEGFPRTIWEAMAHCLPVVATKVGSIPDFITGVAELVEPKNPAALAAGIKKIIHDERIRKEFIKKGFLLASENTLENQVGAMAEVIKEWVEINE